MSEKQELKKWYSVMVENRSLPSQLHDSYESAEKEAKRLAIKERNTTYVLLVVSKIELNDVTITSMA